MRLTSLILAGSIFATPLVAHADEDGSALVAPDHAQHAMRSPALLGSGIALATIGAVAAPIGAIILIVPKSQPECFGPGSCAVDYTSRDIAAVTFLGGGLAAIAASIPMMIIGAKRVPITVGSGPHGSAGLTLEARF